MADVFVDETNLTAIANAIRAKTGKTDTMKVREMASEIAGIDDGISVDDIAKNSQPSGVVTLGSGVTAIADYAFYNKPITEIYAPNATSFGANSFQGTRITSITDANFPMIGRSGNYGIILRMSSLQTIKLSGDHIHLANGSMPFQSNANLVSAEFPYAQTSVGASYKGVYRNCFKTCPKLQMADVGKCSSIGQDAFNGDYVFDTLILRCTSVVTLNNINAFTNTPFRGYNSLTGTVYVPSALIEDYKVATNWVTMYEAETCFFEAIEGSEYEL